MNQPSKSENYSSEENEIPENPLDFYENADSYSQIFHMGLPETAKMIRNQFLSLNIQNTGDARKIQRIENLIVELAGSLYSQPGFSTKDGLEKLDKLLGWQAFQTMQNPEVPVSNCKLLLAYTYSILSEAKLYMNFRIALKPLNKRSPAHPTLIFSLGTEYFKLSYIHSGPSFYKNNHLELDEYVVLCSPYEGFIASDYISAFDLLFNKSFKSSEEKDQMIEVLMQCEEMLAGSEVHGYLMRTRNPDTLFYSE